VTGLRQALLWISGAVAVLAVALVLTGRIFPAVTGCAVWAVALIVALLVERRTYKQVLDAPPGPAWKANGERFVDPETGRTVEVYEHPPSGRRAYVAVN
jgi:hypothetical protein